MLTRSAKLFDPEDHKVRQTFSGSKVVYVGRAKPGTAESAAEWQIYKYTYVGNNNTEINFASATNEFKHVWDDRAGYTYEDSI